MPAALHGSGKQSSTHEVDIQAEQEDEDQPPVLNSVRQRSIGKLARDAWMTASVDAAKISHDDPSATQSTRHVGCVTGQIGLGLIDLREKRRNDQKRSLVMIDTASIPS